MKEYEEVKDIIPVIISDGIRIGHHEDTTYLLGTGDLYMQLLKELGIEYNGNVADTLSDCVDFSKLLDDLIAGYEDGEIYYFSPETVAANVYEYFETINNPIQ